VRDSASDRNLLLGILALQMDFITRDQLIVAMNAWVLDKAQILGQILRAQHALHEDEHALLESLVDKHLERRGNDPGQSLAAVCMPDPARQELERIADEQLHDSLAQLTATPPGDGPATSPYAPPTTGRFQILRPHARGGLGDVFVARDEELRREVALKEIQPRHADKPESRARFLLEAEVTGGLEHPGIVPRFHSHRLHGSEPPF
jgi:hypothetical protein